MRLRIKQEVGTRAHWCWGGRAVLASLFLFSAACGQLENMDFGQKKDGEAPQGGSDAIVGSADDADWVKVGVGFDLDPSSVPSGFQLSAASRVLLRIEGCRSGFASNFDSAIGGASAKVYVNDSGCVAKLSGFELNGQAYTPDSGAPFAGAGISAFSNKQKTLTLQIFQSSNISSPVMPSDSIVFGTVTAASGTSVQLLTVDTAQRYNGSTEAAPNFEIRGLPKLTNLEGRRGVFEVLLECQLPLTLGGTACPSAVGGQNQLLTNMAVMIGNDLVPFVYPDYQAVKNIIRRANGTLRANAFQIAVANVQPPKAGFNGGLKVTFKTPSSLATAQRFVVALTSHFSASSTAYGHTAVTFQLADPP